MPHKATILVVEDSEDHVLLLRYAFQKAGMINPVQVVNTGQDAVAYLSRTGPYSDWDRFPLPALVLLDLNLLGLTGFEVLTWIRQHNGMKAWRVAMLTSSDLERDIKMAYELGANAFLVKPVGLDKLVEMMSVLRVHWLKFAQAPEVSRFPTPR
jgi:CheY-like chemotaxis protein